MVATYTGPQEAFKALVEECYKPRSSTKRTRHKIEKKVGKYVGVGALVVGGAVVPALIPLATAAAAVTAGGTALTIYGATDGLPEGISGYENRKDMPCLPRGVPALDRAEIKSLLRKDEHGNAVKLRDVAGDRAGTTGKVHVKELLESIVVHYRFAMGIWNGPPYRPGEELEQSPQSCQDAEDLYRKFMEVDYHLSKMMAYAQKLKQIATAYETFCTTNAQKLQGYLEDCTQQVMYVLGRSDDWHHTHCQTFEHCYRTSKWSRFGLDKQQNPKAA
jgi:hypothetical protein